MVGRVFYIRSSKKPHSIEKDCHNNCLRYISTYGGEHRLCYHFTKYDGIIYASLHSLVFKDNNYLDPTPPEEERIVALLPSNVIKNYSPFVSWDGNIIIKKERKYNEP